MLNRKRYIQTDLDTIMALHGEVGKTISYVIPAGFPHAAGIYDVVIFLLYFGAQTELATRYPTIHWLPSINDPATLAPVHVAKLKHLKKLDASHSMFHAAEMLAEHHRQDRFHPDN